MALTSTKNAQLQSIRRAAAAGRETEEGMIVAEGPHLLEEALNSRWQVEQIFATARGIEKYARLVERFNVEVIEVGSQAFASITATENSQEILALVRPCAWTWQDLTADPALVVILDALQDPGNAGTIVRSAEAFGATGVVLLEGCARVANGKFLRATAGSIFRMPFQEGVTAIEVMENARRSGLRLLALVTRDAARVHDADLRGACGLITGSEGAGISGLLLASAQTVSIPTGRVESLNAAVACSIALFEARRQRGAEPGSMAR